MLAVNLDRYMVCIECERSLDTAFDPTFLIEEEDVLCLDCAIKRGGLYDAGHETWLRAPDVNDLY